MYPSKTKSHLALFVSTCSTTTFQVRCIKYKRNSTLEDSAEGGFFLFAPSDHFREVALLIPLPILNLESVGHSRFTLRNGRTYAEKKEMGNVN